jgi:oligogalacturonide transport system permease protein
MSGDSRFLGFWYVLPYVLGLLVFTAIPFVASLWLSFTDYRLMQGSEFVGLRNYVDLFTDDRTFAKSLNVTLLYVAMTVPLKLAFALFIAVVLNYKLKGIGFFRTEPRRVCRRLQLLSRMEHHEQDHEQVFP